MCAAGARALLQAPACGCAPQHAPRTHLGVHGVGGRRELAPELVVDKLPAHDGRAAGGVVVVLVVMLVVEGVRVHVVARGKVVVVRELAATQRRPAPRGTGAGRLRPRPWRTRRGGRPRAARPARPHRRARTRRAHDGGEAPGAARGSSSARGGGLRARRAAPHAEDGGVGLQQRRAAHGTALGRRRRVGACRSRRSGSAAVGGAAVVGLVAPRRATLAPHRGGGHSLRALRGCCALPCPCLAARAGRTSVAAPPRALAGRRGGDGWGRRLLSAGGQGHRGTLGWRGHGGGRALLLLLLSSSPGRAR